MTTRNQTTTTRANLKGIVCAGTSHSDAHTGYLSGGSQGHVEGGGGGGRFLHRVNRGSMTAVEYVDSVRSVFRGLPDATPPFV